ncbi:MAG: hypothetical protein H7832_02140 [Magnetococcus sp. DMHC-6]
MNGEFENVSGCRTGLKRIKWDFENGELADVACFFAILLALKIGENISLECVVANFDSRF